MSRSRMRSEPCTARAHMCPGRRPDQDSHPARLSLPMARNWGTNQWTNILVCGWHNHRGQVKRRQNKKQKTVVTVTDSNNMNLAIARTRLDFKEFSGQPCLYGASPKRGRPLSKLYRRWLPKEQGALWWYALAIPPSDTKQTNSSHAYPSHWVSGFNAPAIQPLQSCGESIIELDALYEAPSFPACYSLHC